MPRRNEYVEWLAGELSPLGQIRTRAMFGGWGIYCDALFFALVADDVLYLKVDAQTQPRFEAEGLRPFEYAMKDGRLQKLNYYTVPDSALESPPELLSWSRLALGAALRAHTSKPAARPRRPQPE